MKAAVLQEVDGTHIVENVTVSDPLDDEVQIQTVAAGVCHSDLFGQSGGNVGLAFPVVLGHEASGIVTDVGRNVTYVQPGDRVVVCPGGACGACHWCARGYPQHCVDNGRVRADGQGHRLTLDGGPVTSYSGIGAFAEEMLVSERTVAKIPEEMPLDAAALLGCAVITGIGAVRHTARVEMSQTVAVIGCGGVGLNAIQGAALAGAARVIAVDLVAAKLDMAKSFGATDLVDASSVDPVEAVRDVTAGGVDHVIEVVGQPHTIQQAFAMLGVAGTATVVGLARVGDHVTIPAAQLLMEKKLQGSRLGGTRLRVDIPLYAQMYLDGRIELDALVAARGTLSGVDAALAALDGPSGRTLVEFA